MPLVYPNIVPENNLRLPDALTVKHGPHRLLSRFVLAGDRYARERGLRLRLKYDFEDLAWVNKHYVAQGSWYPIIGEFNPEHSELTPETAFWVAGEDENGEVAATYAGHIYYWPETSLEEQALTVFYGRDEGQSAIVTTPVARTMRDELRCSVGAARLPRQDPVATVRPASQGLRPVALADRLDHR